MNAFVTNIQGYSIHDGPGIRTVVFFKGCNLTCRWCANPEGIHEKPEVGFIEKLCQHCGRCINACPNGAIQIGEGLHRINYALCVGCGRCTEACTYDALVLYGKPMSVDEVYDAVKRDKMFYDPSGGGVTVSGGDPLLHASFIKELFEKCHENGINTCVETSGFVNTEGLFAVLPLTDHLLFDLKLMNVRLHKEYTGQQNDLILKNARLAVESGVNLLFRMPLIPGINDAEENIAETSKFIKELEGNDARIELLPYHRLGQSKYSALNLPYTLPDTKAMEAEQVDAVKDVFIANGVACTISR